MPSVRARRPLLFLAPLLVAAALAAWLLRDSGGGASPGGSPERPEASGGVHALPTPRAHLAGRRGGTPEKGADQAPARPPAPRGAPAPGGRPPDRTLHVVPSRVVDAVGHPVPHARVDLSVVKNDGPVQVRLGTDENGHVELAWPEGKVVSLEIRVSGPRKEFAVVVRQDDRGIDLGGLDEIRLEDLVYVPVRTVDPWRTTRPRQRILFRPCPEGEEPGEWWGATSDADARLTLGPFAFGVPLEFRAGPRGLSSDSITDSAAWQRATADGAEIDVVVPGTPKLQLAFPGLSTPTRVAIAVLDTRTGRYAFPPECPLIRNGTWTAPALADDLDPEVVVGPLDDGRFARLEHVRRGPDPVVVRLRPGRALTGRITSRDADGPWTGQVAAYGRGFSVLRSVDAAGRFSFAGVPDEPFTLVATARPRVWTAGSRSFGGLVHRRDEQEVDIPLRPLVHLRGTVVEEGDGAERPSRRLAEIQATSDDLPPQLQPRTQCGNRFELLLFPGRWHLNVRTKDGERRAGCDLGDVQADRDGVVLHLR